MARNGSRRPPRPDLSASIPSASPEEAAAIAAALEQFLAEQAPRPRPATPISRWQRTALLEGIERAAGLGDRRGPSAA